MPTKAERTRNHIIQTSSMLFHQKGYANTSMSDILDATGLSKGGVYGNFESKEEIVLEAFKYNTSLLFKRNSLLMNNDKLSSIEKLYSILKLHYKNINDLKLAGQCPLLNTAVEIDDTNPELMERVVEVMDQWQQSLKTIISEGKAKQEIKDNIDANYYVGLFVSMVEGGIFLSRIYKNQIYIDNNLQEIKKIIIRDLVRI